MKVLVLFSLALLGLQACGNSTNEDDKAVMKDPSTVHPPSEAIPDSTKLVNDSAIMPDVTPNNGSQVGQSDSIQRNKQ